MYRLHISVGRKIDPNNEFAVSKAGSGSIRMIRTSTL